MWIVIVNLTVNYFIWTTEHHMLLSVCAYVIVQLN